MGRFLTLLYGVVAYVLFLASFLYAIGFVGNLVVPKTIDSGVDGPIGLALLINVVLLGLFAVQHSVMARRGFKAWWTKFVPWPIERSTFVLITSLLLFLIFWQWQPMTSVVWSVESPVGAGVLTALFWIGWVIVLISTFLINHFDLFGLRQVHAHFANKELSKIDFTTTGLYKYIRHPILLGFIVAFWATPLMTTGHLLFAIATTGYMLMAIPLEERDLIHFHHQYAEYRKRVPALLPWKGRVKQPTSTTE